MVTGTSMHEFWNARRHALLARLLKDGDNERTLAAFALESGANMDTLRGWRDLFIAAGKLAEVPQKQLPRMLHCAACGSNYSEMLPECPACAGARLQAEQSRDAWAARHQSELDSLQSLAAEINFAEENKAKAEAAGDAERVARYDGWLVRKRAQLAEMEAAQAEMGGSS